MNANVTLSQANVGAIETLPGAVKAYQCGPVPRRQDNRYGCYACYASCR
jgi:hypothetical protein